MLDLWLTWCSQECCAIFLIFKNIFIVIIGVILQQNAKFLGGNLTLTLFWYVTLTSDDLETTTKQLAGHVLVINDTVYLIIHHLVRMLCTNLDCLDVGWPPFWIFVKIGHFPWRDLWGFSTVDRKGTNELISGEKSFIAILSNLRVYFVVRLPDYYSDRVKHDFAKRYIRFSVIDTVNKTNTSIISKIFTHSIYMDLLIIRRIG